MRGPEVLIPITFFATIGAVFISRREIGRALAHRIRGGADPGAEARAELAELREEVMALRHELLIPRSGSISTNGCWPSLGRRTNCREAEGSHGS